jgi:hypothetical protein
MGTGRLLPILTAGSAVILFQTMPQPVAAQNHTAVLTGHVSSEAEGAMEGVVVTAKKPGATVSVSVISDAQGRFSFPANRLEAGKYQLTIRAIGYDLAGPSTADVADEQTRRSISSSARPRISPPR